MRSGVCHSRDIFGLTSILAIITNVHLFQIQNTFLTQEIRCALVAGVLLGDKIAVHKPLDAGRRLSCKLDDEERLRT